MCARYRVKNLVRY